MVAICIVESPVRSIEPNLLNVNGLGIPTRLSAGLHEKRGSHGLLARRIAVCAREVYGGAMTEDRFGFGEIAFPCLDKLFCQGVELVGSVPKV